MHADADEFLWIRDYRDLKELLNSYRRYNYLSFGKLMYSVQDRVAVDDSGFGLDAFPFHAGPFCRKLFNRENKAKTDQFSWWWRLYRKFRDSFRHKGDSWCPIWLGRAKTIVRPTHHRRIDVHGERQSPWSLLGQKHFDTSVAHFKEWSHMFGTFPIRDREQHNFAVSSESEILIHDLEDGHARNTDGNFTIYFDGDLHGWFQHVSRLAPSMLVP